eukprot:m.12897 g.12897  ORF g.12897 m.12897 type:complete len:107 (+) comp7362_c0_seq1:399-719(+)
MMKSMLELRKEDKEELYRELESTVEVFMPKSKVLSQFNSLSSQIDEIRQMIHSLNPERKTRVWDNDLQVFREKGAPHGHIHSDRRRSFSSMSHLGQFSSLSFIICT